MQRRSINEFTDAELANMVRKSVYMENAIFGREENDCQYLVLFAVPYGKSDEVNSLSQAVDAFAEFIQDSDWRERNIQVYNAYKNEYRTITPETL